MSKRPGYRPQPTIYRLKFEGVQYDGLEVDARSLPLGQLFELQELQEKAQSDNKAAKEVIHRLADVVAGWNVEDEDGTPVPTAYAICKVSGKPGEPGRPCSHHQNDEAAEPCEYAGMCTLELSFVLAIFWAWLQAVAGVPNPSLPASNGGGTSQELSIPMEVSSPSQPS